MKLDSRILRGQIGKALGFGLIAAAVIFSLITLTSAVGLAILLTSWASSTALILTSPTIRASAPHRVALCHIVTALIGLAAHALLPASGWAIGTAVGIGIAVALIGDLMHPPAMGNVAFAFVSNAPAEKFAAVALMGGILLAVVASVRRRGQPGDGATERVGCAGTPPRHATATSLAPPHPPSR